jgi:chorismate mutase
MISQYDTIICSILNNTFNEKTFINETLLCSQFCFEEDKEIASLCKNKEHEELLLMFISMRLSLSESIAHIKFRNNPFTYLNKSNDFLKEITDRDVEKTIITNYKDPIYLKIMELSKNIQVKYLEKYTSQVKIGYLYGRGTFSHEAVQNFRGIHISYSSLDNLKKAHFLKEVDFILVPSYNSIIGEIFNMSTEKLGSIDHTIELNLYGNRNTNKAEFLFIEPHIEKECSNYIKNLKFNKVIYTKSSVDGLNEIISYNNSCLTISSAKNECNLVYTLDKNIVKHNITTFSLY